MSEKSSFNMQMTLAQKEVIEMMLDFNYDGNASKAAYLWNLVYADAMQLLCLPEGLNLSPELLLDELIQKKVDEQEAIKATIGEEKYNELMLKFKNANKKKSKKVD